MKHQFFGNPQSQIFGVYHRPRGVAPTPTRAVLICPPIGQEYIRTHWCLRLLANQIARNGTHVLRIDYRGMGDSSGDLQDVDRLDQWTDDILVGVDRLKMLSGAGTVMLVGLRFGAALCARVAEASNEVNSVVFWEPVVDGAEHLKELRGMHRQMLDLWVCKMTTPDDDQCEEILGSRFSRSLVNQINALENDFRTVVQPHLIVGPKSHISDFAHPQPTVQKVMAVDDDYNWLDLRSLETAWLRSPTVRKIVEMTDDMFERLNSFNALAIPAIVEASDVNVGICDEVDFRAGAAS